MSHERTIESPGPLPPANEYGFALVEGPAAPEGFEVPLVDPLQIDWSTATVIPLPGDPDEER